MWYNSIMTNTKENIMRYQVFYYYAADVKFKEKLVADVSEEHLSEFCEGKIVTKIIRH